MKTLEEIKEFAAKCCKKCGYNYKLEVLPFIDGYHQGFQKAVEEYEKLINNKENGREIETYK
jgi:hypothetical protein